MHRKSIRTKVWELWFLFFTIRVIFQGQWRFTGQKGKGGNIFSFYSITSTCWWTFRHLFATLYVRWLCHIFNRNTCIYQTATGWDLPPYRITIWLIDDVMLTFVFLLDDFILGFRYSNLMQEIDGLELAPAITLLLQVNELTKCASHPNFECRRRWFKCHSN